MLRLLFLFTAVPLVELWLLLEIGAMIGPLSTVAIILITGVVGASLARWQGVLCLQTVQKQVSAGQLPTDSLLDGLGIMVAAALLVTPGILTDVVGFGLLIPPVRRIIRRIVAKRIRAKISNIASSSAGSVPGGQSPQDHDRIIDVRIIDSDDDDSK
jgi:UPF0716 protein FxsA